MDSVEIEKYLKIVGDKTRLHILKLIYQGEVCGCELIHGLDVSQPTLSHHLKVLSEAGFIKGIKEKNRVNYTVDIKRVDTLFKALKAFITEDIKTC